MCERTERMSSVLTFQNKITQVIYWSSYYWVGFDSLVETCLITDKHELSAVLFSDYFRF